MARYTGRQPSISSGSGSMKSRSALQAGSSTSLAVGRDFEEFASLQLDKPSEGELKTTEEMKRHLYDDHFEGRPIERALHLLNNGEEVQRLSVIRQLLQLIQADEQGCMQRVFPKIQQALNTASTEFHLETARAFVTILEKKAIHHHAFSQTFLPSILYHIDNRDPVVSNAWLETLLEVAELLPTELLKHEVLHVAINKGQISQSVWHRVAACKLLGKMCARFDQHTVKKDILPVVHSLCQDVNESVRACICSQLHHVAKGLLSDMVKPALIPILVELGRDETVQVRVEATETIVHMIPFLTQEVLKVTIIPLVKKICEQALLAMDDTLVMVAKQFGSLCIGLESSLSLAEKLWMVTYYHNLSHLGIPSHGGKKDVYFTSHNMDRINTRYIECRQLCAYNFPAMAKFCTPNAELLEKLFPSFCDFSTDPYYMVRKTIGAGIHEVARILGINNRVVKNQIMTLLWDSMEEVLMGVVPHLGRTIDLLIGTGVLGQEQDGATLELGRGLIQCDKTIRDKTHNWRLYADFITQLESIVRCLPSDYIYTHFVGLMFDKMHRARPLPCRLAAARTLLVFLRHDLKNNQRQEIRARIEAEFCMSSSCYKRMLFLRLCNIAREIFSRAYFKEHFFYLLLSRSEDKVANNRLLLVRQFPHLKAMIVMPTEKKYLQTLEQCVRSMVASEKDRDVSAELRHSIARLDKTDTISESSTMPTLDDIEDRKKYEEEIRFANTVPRPGAGIAISTLDNRRAPKEIKPQRPPNAPKVNQPMPTTSSGSTVSPLSPGRQERSYGGSGSSSASSTRKTSPVSPDSNLSSQSSIASFTNSSNDVYSVRSTLINHDTNNEHNCTCYTSFRSDYQENLNLRALIDTNMEKSKFKMLDNIKQKISSDVKYKISRSCKYNMEISWLNLETDLKNELFTLVNNSRIHGDRNFKEKSKFLTDFRDFNDASLSKFINDDREYKETIYNVKGISNYYNRFSSNNFFEEKVNFFERKIKLEEAKSNTDYTDCSCFDLTSNNQRKYFDGDENKKISYFSKNFEEDFYRDAGIKANEIISRKFSAIPIYDKPQVSSPKIATSVTNKRRTWLDNENSNRNSLDLDSICKYSPRDNEKSYQRKKSETLPMRESISLEKIGIGPRSKSFILPSTLIYSDKQITNYQSTKLIFDKQVNDILKKESLNESVDSTENKNYYNNQGAIRKFRSTESDSANRFGFRPRTRDNSPKIETKTSDKSFPKTKIPVGRNGSSSSSSPNSSRSSSPSLSITKEKPDNDIKLQNNGTKKMPNVASRKSLLLQNNSIKNDIKNNRRSLDSTKINLANLDKPQNHVYNKRKTDKSNIDKLKTGGNSLVEGNLSNSGGIVEDKTDGEVVVNANSSKLPVRRTRPEK